MTPSTIRLTANICFITCGDWSSIPGLMGVVTSVRKFYTAHEADIVVFLDGPNSSFEKFCRQNGVQLHFFKDIAGWVLPLVHQTPEFAECIQHFYHPDFKPVPGLDHHTSRETGFHTLRHLHPLNIKAYCTGYCLCICQYEQVVYLDSDSFLLSHVDDLWEAHPGEDILIAFGNELEVLPNLKALFGVQLPQSAADRFNQLNENNAAAYIYGFDAGIVFYKNGPGIRELVREFMFYSDSCYHWVHAGTSGSQGILRALAAKHSLLGKVRLSVEDNINWNPVGRRADTLTFDAVRQEWTNDLNGQIQHLWRGYGVASVSAGSVWKGRNKSPSVNNAWQWIGGTYALDWRDIRGALTPHNCEYVAGQVAEFFAGEPKRRVNILEIGTCFGRTSIAFCLCLQDKGFDVHVDTCDIFAPSPDYPNDYATMDQVQENINTFGLEGCLTIHHVGGNENLLKRFGAQRFDFIYIDGSHEFKQVAADILTALKLVSKRGIIIGDDFNLQDVKDAVYSVFCPEVVTVEHDQWCVTIDPFKLDNLLNIVPKSGESQQANYAPCNTNAEYKDSSNLEYGEDLVELVVDMLVNRLAQNTASHDKPVQPTSQKV